MATPTFYNTEIARVAGALWGSKLGASSMSAVMAAVNANGMAKVVNDAYNASFGAVDNATVAATVVANLGITGSAATPAINAVKATLDGAASGNKGAALVDLLNTYAGMTGDATYGAFATDFNSKVASALTYSQTANTVDSTFVTSAPTPVTSFTLSTSTDALTGSAGDDTFTSRIINTSNTFQSGDVVNGGAGDDRINMDMGSSQGFAVTGETTSIETIQIRAQSRSSDSGDNNVAAAARVDIDGERMVGVNRWDSNNSRADVIVEDVRILDTQITNDITVGFIQSDPGNVDYGLYFDQHSLRANANSSGTLRLQLLDTRAAAEGGAVPPLRDSPYNGVSFTYGGETITLADPAGDDGTYNGPFNKAVTYAELLKAIQDYLAADSRTNGIVTASLGSTFSANDTKSGIGVTGTEILLTAPAELGKGAWIANAGVPADSGLHTFQDTSKSTSQDLIAVKVILDDVGRGNLSGDLVIGGLSVGTTDNCDGVQRFNVTVERTSDLQNMMSTNNKLKEVVIVNGTTKGNLSVRGNDSVVSTAAGSDIHNAPNNPDQLPGMNDVGFNGGNQRDAYGFNDIRLIDASAMTGKVAFDALISAAVLPKYVLLSDTQSDPSGDNTSGVGLTNQVADFKYSGGSNADTIAVLLDTDIASSHSHVLPGHEDFTLNVAGNAGDDRLTVNINDGDSGLTAGAGSVASNWYQHQHVLKNLTIDAGDGNDTVRTPGAGDFTLTLGAGNDTVYTDNTGDQGIDSVQYPNAGRAEWVFNSKDQTVAANVELDNIASDLTNDAMDLYRASITVTYKHLTATVQLPSSNATGAALYKPTDLFVNQAIKNAIMNDAVLSKLLVAEDGPGYSLVVRSLIDGAQVAGDLTVRATPVTVTNLSTTEQAAVIAAYSAADAAALQVLLDAGAAGLGTALVGLDYASALGREGGVAVTGAISITPSDNKVTPGTGDDVIVLGTTLSAAVTEVEQSNDTVVYAGTFGKDTIVHFTVGANTVGGDKLDLSAISGKASGGFLNDVGVVGFAVGAVVSNRIVIDDKVATANDSQTAVIAKFSDSGSATAASQVYIVVDAANVGSVWKITDAAAGTAGAVTAATGSNVTADLMGTIDLADTLWLNMVVANFA